MPSVGIRAEADFPVYEPGSREDFDRLYRDSYPKIYRTMLAVLADPAAAEDCTQDAFVLLRRLGRPAVGPDPAQLALDRDLVTALRSLSPKLRAALVLRHYHGYNNREIAAAVGVSERTVNKRLQIAAERMRMLLARDPKVFPLESAASLSSRTDRVQNGTYKDD